MNKKWKEEKLTKELHVSLGGSCTHRSHLYLWFQLDLGAPHTPINVI